MPKPVVPVIFWHFSPGCFGLGSLGAKRPSRVLREFSKNGPKSRSSEFAETHPKMPTDHIEARWRHFRVESSILQQNRFSGLPYNLAPQEMALRVLCEIHRFRSFLALWPWPTGGNGPPGYLENFQKMVENRGPQNWL